MNKLTPLEKFRQLVKNIPTDKKVFLALTLILIGTAFLQTNYQKLKMVSATTHFVELSDNGFDPRELTVSQGDTVKFTTVRNKYFWPASNTHPTHDIYADFDAKNAVAPNAFWSFQFDRVGEWHYHDHLDPQFSGVIIVVPGSTGETKANCQNIDDASLSKTKRDFCWDVYISKILKKDGIAEAFKFLRESKSENPNFELECHSAAHRIGRSILEEFKKNPLVEIPLESQDCGFGMYHGFMENLFVTGSDIQIAHNFCRSIKYDLVNPSDKMNECYHGVGHGVAEYYYPQSPDNQDLVQKTSLISCETNMNTTLEKGSCGVGVYGWLLNQLPYFEQRKLSPVDYCQKQSESYQDICLMAAMRHFRNFFTDFVTESMDFVLNLKDQAKALHLAQSFARNFANYDRSRNDYLLLDLKNCKALPVASYPQCLDTILKPLKS